jgi:nucleoid-associated protein YgaU
MNPDEIAKIVTLVMKEVEKKQREQKQEPEVQSQSTTEEELNPSSDEALISLLEGSSTDTIQTIKESEEDTATSEAIKNREVKSEKKGENNYNKVFVSKKPKERLSNVDELTQLSREISNIIGNDELASIVSAPESRPDNYTKSIATEATVRSNEMRIIVVQKGDTLGKIALRAYGSAKAYKKIYRANPDLINRPDRIYIGQKLRIPK